MFTATATATTRMRGTAATRGPATARRSAVVSASAPSAVSSFPAPLCAALSRARVSTNLCRAFHTATPVQNFGMLTNPFGTIKQKMSKIDHARVAYEACSLQFYEGNSLLNRFNLGDNLQSWFNVTVLHVWMYSAQLKTLGPEGKEMCQELFATLLLDIEIRLNKAGVRTNIDKITSELISIYYGQILAYDEGLSLGGDGVMAAALWRNIMGADSPDTTAQNIEKLLEYVRVQIQHLDGKDLLDLKNPVGFLPIQ